MYCLNQFEFAIIIINRYQFGDEVHEVLSDDTEPIYIPKRSHSITEITKRLKQEQL